MTQQGPVNEILIASDERASLLSALEKAALVERYTGARLTVAQVIYDPIGEEPATYFGKDETQSIIDKLIATERNELTEHVSEFAARVADLRADVVWDKNPAQGILSEAARIGADLIVKPLSESHGIADFLQAPIDWTLMREAGCPVLFTRQQPWQGTAKVLAAVDASEAEHEALNRAILLAAQTAARTLDAELHLVSVYPSLGQHMTQYQVANDFEGIKSEMKARRTAVLEVFTDRLGLEITETHVLEGRPRIAIAQLAETLGVTLTVLGTAARTGLKKLVIGNTAEDIIRHLGTDLLTVRESDQAD
jgi:nucleotide-binding universal stress UspA family protein